MIKKVTIAKVFFNEKKQDGTPYAYKNGTYAGQPFTRVSIKLEELGDDMFSNNVRAGDKALQLKTGDVVVLNFSESNGFKNFQYPTKGELGVYEQFAAQAA